MGSVLIEFLDRMLQFLHPRARPGARRRAGGARGPRPKAGRRKARACGSWTR